MDDSGDVMPYNYKCDTCAAAFDTQSKLAEHMATHTSESLTCSVCFTNFSSKKTLRSHIKNIHSTEKAYKCTICDREFAVRSHYTQHMLVHSGQRPYICAMCGKSFAYKSVLVAHEKAIHSLDESHKCDVCQKTFQGKSDLAKHMVTHSGEKPHMCSSCGKGFTQKIGLERHMRIHSGERPYVCAICSHAFTQKANLNSHIRKTHNWNQIFACKMCERVFMIEKELSSHMEQHHITNPYKCNLCDDSFPDMDALTCHQKKHIVEKTYACTICSQEFEGQRSLTNHMRVHSGGKSVSDHCSVCNQYFPPGELAKHEKTHISENTEKPYKCNTCKKEFTYKLTLKKHMRKHSGERLLSCAICNKGFTDQYNLNRHLSVHSGEKPYACSRCDKRFREPSVLKNHEKMHDGEFENKCEMCNRGFLRLSELTRHRKLHNQKPFLCASCFKMFDTKEKLEKHCNKLHSCDGDKLHNKNGDTGSNDEKSSTPKCTIKRSSRRKGTPKKRVYSESNDGLKNSSENSRPKRKSGRPRKNKLHDETECESQTDKNTDSESAIDNNTDSDSEEIPQKKARKESKNDSKSMTDDNTDSGSDQKPKKKSKKTKKNFKLADDSACSDLDEMPKKRERRGNKAIKKAKQKCEEKNTVCNGENLQNTNKTEKKESEQSERGEYTLQAEQGGVSSPEHSGNSDHESNSKMLDDDFSSSNEGLEHIYKETADCFANSKKINIESTGALVENVQKDTELQGKRNHEEPAASNCEIELEIQGEPKILKSNQKVQSGKLNECEGTEKPLTSEIESKGQGKKEEIARAPKITVKKPFTCRICNETYSKAESFTTHLATHSDVQLHMCNICSEGFSQKADYDCHMQLHSKKNKGKKVRHRKDKGKALECDICHKKFSTEDFLTRHKKSHKTKLHRTYLCPVCSQEFLSEKAMNTHILWKHNGKTSKPDQRKMEAYIPYVQPTSATLNVNERHNVSSKQNIVNITPTESDRDTYQVRANSPNYAPYANFNLGNIGYSNTLNPCSTYYNQSGDQI